MAERVLLNAAAYRQFISHDISSLVILTRATGVVSADEMAEEGMMAEPISIAVGGRSHWGLSVRDNEAEPDHDEFAISNDVQLTFKGSTVLDSGVEVSVRMDVEGEKNPDPADAGFAEVSGSFGAIRVGNEKTAARKMHTTAPYATYFFGINDSYWGQSASSIQTDPWMTTFADAGVGDSASVLYFSPVINGFQFGASYAPEAGKEAESGTGPTNEGHDVYSIGLRYDGAFGDTGVTFTGGYAHKDVPETEAMVAARPQAPGLNNVGTTILAPNVEGNRKDCPSGGIPLNAGELPEGLEPVEEGVYCYTAAQPGRSVTEWAAGLVVSMAGVSVGGSMSIMDDDMGKDDLTQYDFGIMYGEGPWSVSANVGNQQDDDNNIDNDFVRLLANYNLGPGINLAGAIGGDSPSAGDNKGKDTTFAGVALGISF